LSFYNIKVIQDSLTIKKYLQREEVAEVIAFLASEESSGVIDTGYE
jgi:hypothetical protein